MVRELAKNEDFRLAAARTAQLALYGYRSSLRTKLYAADKAAYSLEKIIRKNENILPQENEKERNTMKRLISALAVVAAAGAALGAAGYYLKKKKEAQTADYEELLYSDEMGEDFVIEEDPMEKFVETAADVKDVVVSAAENVKETVSDAFVEVKEAIDSAIEE